jgi:YVTN family beta-propeller protein
MRGSVLAVLLVSVGASAAHAAAQGPPSESSAPPASAAPYSIYVSSESADVVTRIDVGPGGWRKAREVSVKVVPNEIAGPHHVAVAPDGDHWYVSIAHGTPFGAVWKYDARTDALVARANVGMFPTTVGLSPDGAWAYVPNSDFHGDRGRENTVSALYTPTMKAIAEIPICDMPHGSRWNRSGSLVYVVCMMSDELITIDPGTFAVARRARLGSGKPMTMAEHARAEATADSAAAHAGHGAAPAVPASVPPAPPTLGAGSSTMPGQNPDCLPTYVSVSPDGAAAYVACNHSGELQIRDAATLALVARVQAGAGAYNVEPSPDGRLVLVTNKKAQSVSVIEAASRRELARVPTSKPIPHGIAYSPDGRYAFISCESVGTDEGAIDAVDLTTFARVASLPLPPQPTGIAIRPAR